MTLQPLRLGMDAAILFADILLPLEPMGAPFEFAKGEGPVIHSPVRDRAGIERLRVFEPEEGLGYVLEAVRLIRKELDGKTPLIGFAGAPFTMASYLVEGGKSSDYRLDQEADVERPRGVVAPDGQDRRGRPPLPARAGRRGRAGGAAVRLVGRRALDRTTTASTCSRTCGTSSSTSRRPGVPGHPLRHEHRARSSRRSATPAAR